MTFWREALRQKGRERRGKKSHYLLARGKRGRGEHQISKKGRESERTLMEDGKTEEKNDIRLVRR